VLDTKSRILDTAEEMLRSGGYNGFSFREIAEAVGIKSASVHHHFATKEALTLEVLKLYGENFFSKLGEPMPKNSSPQKQLEHYCDIFCQSFKSSKQSCLCAVLINEAEQLPGSVRELLDDAVQKNVSWLAEVIKATGSSKKNAKPQAELIYSALEGAMGVASLRQDEKWINRVAKSICQSAI